MNFIKRYIYLIVISIFLAFLYALLTTKISFESLLNWSIFLVPSILAFNVLMFVAIIIEILSIVKDIISIDFQAVCLPLPIVNKEYSPTINLLINSKQNYLRTVVIRC